MRKQNRRGSSCDAILVKTTLNMPSKTCIFLSTGGDSYLVKGPTRGQKTHTAYGGAAPAPSKPAWGAPARWRPSQCQSWSAA
jgi:hypothetical protein